MTIREILKENNDIEIELLLEHILKKPKEFLYVHKSHELTSRESREVRQLARRRRKGEPMAYILGYRYFYGLKYKIDKNTLIPRPETEQLVDLVLEEIEKRKFHTIRLLDVGTGSGCIAIAVAKRTKRKVEIHASDISNKALAMAKQNAKKHRAHIRFHKSNLLTNVPGTFDIIVANLPYVPAKVYRQNYQNLKHEPKTALAPDGTHGASLIIKLIKQLPKKINPSGVCLLEIDPSHKDLIKVGAFVKDLAKRTRFCVIQSKN